MAQKVCDRAVLIQSSLVIIPSLSVSASSKSCHRACVSPIDWLATPIFSLSFLDFSRCGFGGETPRVGAEAEDAGPLSDDAGPSSPSVPASLPFRPCLLPFLRRPFFGDFLCFSLARANSRLRGRCCVYAECSRALSLVDLHASSSVELLR